MENTYTELVDLLEPRVAYSRKWITLDAELASDLGLDSLDLMEFCLDVEEKY